MNNQQESNKRIIDRASKTGAWLSVTPNTLAGTELRKTNGVTALAADTT